MQNRILLCLDDKTEETKDLGIVFDAQGHTTEEITVRSKCKSLSEIENKVSNIFHQSLKVKSVKILKREQRDEVLYLCESRCIH